MNARPSAPRARTISTRSAPPRLRPVLGLVEEPDLPQGTWHFGEGTIHHHAFDAGTADNQAR